MQGQHSDNETFTERKSINLHSTRFFFQLLQVSEFRLRTTVEENLLLFTLQPYATSIALKKAYITSIFNVCTWSVCENVSASVNILRILFCL
jgi:hypothetical protein